MSGRAQKDSSATLASCTADMCHQAGNLQLHHGSIRIYRQRERNNARAWEDAPRRTPPPSAGTCPGGSGCKTASPPSSCPAPCTASQPARMETRIEPQNKGRPRGRNDNAGSPACEKTRPRRGNLARISTSINCTKGKHSQHARCETQRCRIHFQKTISGSSYAYCCGT